MDDWDDMDEQVPARTRPSGRRREPSGLSRNQRYAITLAVVAAFMLILGLVLGFSIGRTVGARSMSQTKAPVATQTQSVTPSQTLTEATPTQIATEPAVTTTPTTPARTVSLTPKQISPSDGQHISTSHVDLTWSKVTPSDGGTVRYSFQIETLSGGSWGDLQTLTGIHSTSYSVRVLTSLRRWRVWAVVDGVAGPKTGWRTYRHTTVSSSKTSTSTTSG